MREEGRKRGREREKDKWEAEERWGKELGRGRTEEKEKGRVELRK